MAGIGARRWISGALRLSVADFVWQFSLLGIAPSRTAASAQGGEILVANAIRELSSGRGFLFADRGDFIAKCFEKPVRVYEISWRNNPAS
jgi:hypothetical protein